MQFKIVANILAKQISLVLHDVIGVEQSSFLKGCQILHGPLMDNELVAWFKKKKKKLMLFKDDFEKAYDSICWDYLDQVMLFMRFGDKQRSWIRGLFRNSKSLVILNGKSVEEFQLFKWLRQDDRVSPFLFIIAMESLHVAREGTVVDGIFHQVPFEAGDLLIYHLFMQIMHCL